jgi:hypothetical protein
MRRMLRHLSAVGLVALVGAGAFACTAYPAVPSSPAYDTDVLPIFEAHCTRCHGAGGNLNNASFPGTNGGPKTTSPPFLTQYGDTGCSSDPNYPYCAQEGANTWKDLIQSDIHLTTDKRMPLPPAAALDAWEMEVIDNWHAEGSMPICSRSSNPDPALACP